MTSKHGDQQQLAPMWHWFCLKISLPLLRFDLEPVGWTEVQSTPWIFSDQFNWVCCTPKRWSASGLVTGFSNGWSSKQKRTKEETSTSEIWRDFIRGTYLEAFSDIPQYISIYISWIFLYRSESPKKRRRNEKEKCVSKHGVHFKFTIVYPKKYAPFTCIKYIKIQCVSLPKKMVIFPRVKDLWEQVLLGLQGKASELLGGHRPQNHRPLVLVGHLRGGVAEGFGRRAQ